MTSEPKSVTCASRSRRRARTSGSGLTPTASSSACSASGWRTSKTLPHGDVRAQSLQLALVRFRQPAPFRFHLGLDPLLESAVPVYRLATAPRLARVRAPLQSVRDPDLLVIHGLQLAQTPARSVRGSGPGAQRLREVVSDLGPADPTILVHGEDRRVDVGCCLVVVQHRSPEDAGRRQSRGHEPDRVARPLLHALGGPCVFGFVLRRSREEQIDHRRSTATWRVSLHGDHLALDLTRVVHHGFRLLTVRQVAVHGEAYDRIDISAGTCGRRSPFAV